MAAPATARVLHRAIEDAVQQLEPQLLPLFNHTRNPREQHGREPKARDQAMRPTARTHGALKMLVALTRFFPEEHRVCKAGRQLEMLWPPLVHEPRGAAACALLNHYFRLRQDLFDTPEAALRYAMRDLVRSAIDTAHAPGGALRVDDCERRLRSLAAFLPEPGVETAQLARLSPLAQLFAWQLALEASAEQRQRACVDPLLMPDMLAVIDRCTALCRASEWSLDYLCNSGLARGLWQLRGMARFCGNSAMANLFEELDDECLDMHLAGSKPQAGTLQQWLVRLFEVVHDRSVLRLLPGTDNAPELPFRAIYDQELASYRQQLQTELQTELTDREHADPRDVQRPCALRVTAALITLLYKLTWVFAAAEQADWARLCQCAYRVALQYWRIRRPVNSRHYAILLELAQTPGTLVADSVLRRWRWQLLQDWPSWAADSRRPIALRPQAEHVVALEAVPDLLSGSFTALVQAGRLTELPSARACHPYFQVLVQDLASELLQELALLEKGAAAMKVWPLEQLCTLLIAVYETHLRDAVELPAELLQTAHRQLVRMLDQAAAWHDVEGDQALVQALEQWMQDGFDLRSACREPQALDQAGGDAACEQALRVQLLSCLGTLAAVLERPVRLQLDAGGLRLEAGRINVVLDCVRPLIKFMLLDQTVDARTRHAMHKPRVSTLSVTLRATSATLSITVGEDSHENLLPQPELQRLQRRLPKAAGTLVCESHAGRGRSLTFTLN